MSPRLLVALVLLAAVAHARFHSSQQSPLGAYPARYFTQQLTHFDAIDTRTFQQKFYVNDAYWNAARPRFILYINGEGPVSGPPSNASEVGVLAARHGALIVTLEHRFYGESQPLGDWRSESLVYLSSRQALNDLAAFRQFVQRTWAPAQNASDAQWITVGGSYSGALSAWFRLKYPHLTLGSLASSGVINAVLDYTRFDEQVAASAGVACTRALQNITAYMNEQLDKPLTATAVKMRFSLGAHAQLPATDGDFYYFLGDAMALAIQYGAKHVLCEPLLAVQPPTQTALVDAFFAYVQSFFYGRGFGSWAGYATPGCQNTTIDVTRADRQWWWQTCTEFGYFQPAPAANSVRSTRLTLDYFRQHCADLFGAGVWPDTEATNSYYGGATNAATNVIYANGGEDPWRWASATQSLGPTQPLVIADCYECGHCVDLHAPNATADAPSLVAARAQIAAFVAQLFDGAPSPSDSAVVEWRTAFIATAAAAVALAIVALVCYHRLNEARAASAGQLQRGHAEAGHPFNLLPTV